MFALSLTDIAWNQFEPIMNGIQYMEKFIKRLNSWGLAQSEWHSMKFYHTKHDVEQFVYDLKL